MAKPQKTLNYLIHCFKIYQYDILCDMLLLIRKTQNLFYIFSTRDLLHKNSQELSKLHFDSRYVYDYAD